MKSIDGVCGSECRHVRMEGCGGVPLHLVSLGLEVAMGCEAEQVVFIPLETMRVR